MGKSSGVLIVGMRGPRETISQTFVDKDVDWTAAKALTLTITQLDGRVVQITSWSWSYPTPTSALATYVPDGTEITAPGRAHLTAELYVGGTWIGTRSYHEEIKDR